MRKYYNIAKNKYFISSLVLVVILLFFEDTNLFGQYKMNKKLTAFQVENQQKLIEIEELKLKINELTTNQKELEKFARETYCMKKNDEVIFLFVEEE